MKKFFATALITAVLGLLSLGQASAKDVPTVRYGVYDPGFDSGFLLMAREKGFWEAQGVKVEVITFKSASQAFPAFIAGEIDVVQANPSEALLASAKGADIKFIGSTMPGLNYTIYSKPKFQTLADLSGATIGVGGPAALPAVVAKAMLMAKGVDLASVTFANSGGSPDRYRAVVNGLVDAASSPSDYIGRAEADKVKVLAMAKDVVPDYPRYALITSSAFLHTENGEGVVGLIAGLIQGMRYAVDHPDEANALSAATVGGLAPDDPSILAAYREFKEGGYLALNGEIPVKQMKYLADLQAKLGISSAPVNVDPLVDDSYRQQAVARVGTVKSTYYGGVE
ncbi:ABC transporter substrate-binding protein [Oleomonas cavernae]|uniref:ABC transporter substrate-binding protein n=1 Tax=Oleomonas cavernae TaxID=2320859 RepID=A0A418W8L8_9PROT|nr:ABC transporter substrate-binding protein [Oleomonas cavernae]RJF86361.1 ABC transporter substrate-binding protein [Oleomonas cavernae]